MYDELQFLFRFSYSRLDCVFVSQTLLDYHPASSIGLRLWSNHCLSIFPSGGFLSCRLNDNLLSDLLCIQAITQAIRDFSHTHASDTTSPLTQWESLKHVNQGGESPLHQLIVNFRYTWMTCLFMLLNPTLAYHLCWLKYELAFQ